MDQTYPKKIFPVENRKIALLRAPMVVTDYIKLLHTGDDRHSEILMSLLFLFAVAMNEVSENSLNFLSFTSK